MQVNSENQVIPVRAQLRDGSGYTKAVYFNVRFRGEVHQMYFARKWQAAKYLAKCEARGY